jgi:hypothetical protein
MNLFDPKEREAHRIYEAAITFVSLGCVFDRHAMKSVGAALRSEASRTPHKEETEILLVMAKYLEARPD